MMHRGSETDELLARASAGDGAARQSLLGLHRGRLKRMVRLRMDGRLAARLDPSDVVQEVLAEASKRMSEYLRRRPMAFYPWLRQMAWERLLQLHRHHLHTKRRAAAREDAGGLELLADDSGRRLADRLISNGTTPSGRLMRDELRERVRQAMEQLDRRDREVLVLRYLEQLSTAEIAEVLGLSEAAVKARHYRALVRLRARLGSELEGNEP